MAAVLGQTSGAQGEGQDKAFLPSTGRPVGRPLLGVDVASRQVPPVPGSVSTLFKRVTGVWGAFLTSVAWDRRNEP